MPHVLFVCTANICRSPVAVALFGERLQAAGMTDWTVRSAGTWAMVGQGAARNSIQVIADRRLDITAHRARMVNVDMLQAADLVLCMETGHVEALQAEFPAQAHKIFLLTEMVGRRYSITDPYGHPLKEYQRMAAEIDQLIERGWPNIIELAQKKP